MKYKKYFYLIILLFIASINFNLFIKSNNLICGGTNGLGIIINYFFNIDIALIILLINIIMLLLSIIFLNKNMTLSLIISSFLYPLFIKLTANLTYNLINIYIVTLSAIITGITSGFIYKLGLTAGGIYLLSPLINKYLKIKIGTINLIINSLITLFNFIINGLNNYLYAILFLIINSFIINLILYKKIN